MGDAAAIAMPPDGPAALERFMAAHRALRADPDLQFTLQRAKPPTPPPAWLTALGDWLARVFRPVGRFLGWIGSLMPDAPVARYLLWALLAAAAVALLWFAIATIRRRAGWRRPPIAPDETPAVEEWQPEAAPARQWLVEADALAGEGRYAEAVHHLLLRSIEDVARRRPGLVRPALTSRELSAAPALPPRARTLFAGIAAIVERGLFGGRPVPAGDWQEARAAYADFIKGPSWKPAG